MTISTLREVCSQISTTTLIRDALDVSWHGGEPLTVPLTWYKTAISLMAEHCPTTLELRHRFQTNGLLLNNRWAEFLMTIRARIGLSIDGPSTFHDSRRRTRRGQGTHQQAMKAVRLLNEAGIDFHVITVLTSESIREPDRLFEFYVASGIKTVGFNVEEIEAANAYSSTRNKDAEETLRRFYRRFFELTHENTAILNVREFDTTIASFLSDAPIRDDQNEPFAIVSIAHNGDISTFSPELLGAKHDRWGAFILGNIRSHRLDDLVTSPLFLALNDEVRRGVSACKTTCSYFLWCGGGAPANKLFETGTFASTETYHCRLSRQAVIDEMITSLEPRFGLAPAGGINDQWRRH
jgi:uncharacterized protein